MKIAAFSLLVVGASAFPWVANQPGVTSPWSSVYRASRVKRQQPSTGPGSAAECPYNKDHVPAAPFNSKFPYNGAQNGQKGNGKGGYLVPAPGDTAHQFIAPTKNDIRGPCPGLNTAANHNFLARDGITTYNELVDAQQNVYNVGYDLANLLAMFGLMFTDGDPVTEKLSIGCDATTRTSFNPLLTGSEPGLDAHNQFEADTSLTRDDYFLGDGDDFTFNGTLFGMMDETCNSNFDLNGLALYRNQRWHQSQKNNPDFFFGPFEILLYGAASFLYELFPGANDKPDLPTISSFFGAEKNSDGTWSFNGGERIPPNWTPRLTPYSNSDVTIQILAMYLKNPVLFGGNTASGAFDTINFGSIKNGSLPVDLSPANTECLLFQLTLSSVPTSLDSVVTPTAEGLDFALSKLSPMFDNLGCSRPLT